MTTSILAVSDLHVEFDHFYFPLQEIPDLLILAGDIGYGASGVAIARTHFAGPFPKIVICGNHEHYEAQYDEVLALCRSEAARADDVFFLEQGEANFTIRGKCIRILGCTLW